MASNPTHPALPGSSPLPPSTLSDRELKQAQQAQRIWDYVSASPLHCLWDLRGAPVSVILKRTYKAFLDDNLLSRAAELGFYFLFALFPTLVCASNILGIAARQATSIYVALLQYLAYIIPRSAYDIVLQTFNQTTAASNSGKLTFGLAAALWSASVGFAAIQDTLNIVYKVKETRPYWKARLSAMGVTLLLAIIFTLILSSLLIGTSFSHYAFLHLYHRDLQLAAETVIHTFSWLFATGLIILFFSVIYYFAPDVKNSRWHWLTPGAAIGILGWVVASLALRLYLHFFDNYSLTYGSLGAVIILLTWFYITGLMLLLGAELNSEIEAAATEKMLHQTGELPPTVSADPDHPLHT